MTAQKLALIKTSKMIGFMILVGLLVGTILNFIPLNYIMIAGATAFLIFMLKMVYDMNLAQAKLELQERNIDSKQD